VLARNLAEPKPQDFRSRLHAEIAHHEAGHAVVALRYGADLEAVVVAFDDWLNTPRLSTRTLPFVTRYKRASCLAITFAGPAAAARFKGKRLHPRATDGGAATREIREGQYPPELARYYRECAVAWIAHEPTWRAIEAVASALVTKGHLTGPAAERIVRHALGRFPSVWDESVRLPVHPGCELVTRQAEGASSG
jgi:hypothetical protein